MSQMKEEKKCLEKELSKMEASNLLDTEFKMLIIRKFKKLMGRIDELSKTFYKKIA